MMAKSLMSSGAGDLTASVEKDAKLVNCGVGARQRASSGRLLDRSGPAAACAASECCRAPLTRPLRNAAIAKCTVRGSQARPPSARAGKVLARCYKWPALVVVHACVALCRQQMGDKIQDFPSGSSSARTPR